MSEQTLMPVLDREEESASVSSFQFPTPSISEEYDLLRGSDTPVRWDAATFHRSFKVLPRTIQRIRQETEEVTLLEKWEGYVSEILPDGFRARLHRNVSDFEEVVAEFEFSELADDDRKILAEGMPLVWSITRERRHGCVQRCSVLVLRRQPRQLLSDQEDFAGRLNEWIHTPESTGR